MLIDKEKPAEATDDAQLWAPGDPGPIEATDERVACVMLPAGRQSKRLGTDHWHPLRMIPNL